MPTCCTQIDGRYVVVTINISTSASAPRPSSSCVHIIAYEPLTRERAEVKVSGWELLGLNLRVAALETKTSVRRVSRNGALLYR